MFVYMGFLFCMLRLAKKNGVMAVSAPHGRLPHAFFSKEGALFMNTPEIALGFTNTLDYEMVWDTAYLQALCNKARMCLADIHEYPSIHNMQQLLGSFLYHFRLGTGAGAYVEDEKLLCAILEGSKSHLSLGGTAVRAAQVLSTLKQTTLLHLVSHNPETLQYLPYGASWICSRDTPSHYPHLTLQFPKGAELCIENVCITAPSANRVIYTKDEDNAQLRIAPNFFEQADGCRLMVLSSFDIVQQKEILLNRLSLVQQGLLRMCHRCIVFYEDAHFTHPEFPELIWDALLPLIDVYSMNEDEFAHYVGHALDLLSPLEVADALAELALKINVPCLVVHTKYWALAFGPLAHAAVDALQQGIAVAGTRYRLGDVWTIADLEHTKAMSPQVQSVKFADVLHALLPKQSVCLPAYALHPIKATTIGLGDSFVGGFASAFPKNILPKK